MGELLSDWSVATAITVLTGAGMVIVAAGWRMANLADILADRTGLGEAIVGALFLGAATSLPGIVTSATAAHDGYPDLAFSNALGGIAAQTLFLCVGDIFYLKSNLEHAAASLQNILQANLLLTLLAMILMAVYTPSIVLWGIHPVTPVLLVVYLLGLRMIRHAGDDPMWRPRHTSQTHMDVPEQRSQGISLTWLWFHFAALAMTVGFAGWILEHAAIVITEVTDLSQAVVGGFLTAIVTSLPELVTTVAAVRRGALTLAVGGILGGNAFDTLFVAVADGFYREGSLYQAASSETLFLLSLTLLLTAVILMGLVRREKYGWGNIGFESLLVIGLYCGGALLLLLGLNGS